MSNQQETAGSPRGPAVIQEPNFLSRRRERRARGAQRRGSPGATAAAAFHQAAHMRTESGATLFPSRFAAGGRVAASGAGSGQQQYVFKGFESEPVSLSRTSKGVGMAPGAGASSSQAEHPAGGQAKGLEISDLPLRLPRLVDPPQDLENFRGQVGTLFLPSGPQRVTKVACCSADGRWMMLLRSQDGHGSWHETKVRVEQEDDPRLICPGLHEELLGVCMHGGADLVVIDALVDLMQKACERAGGHIPYEEIVRSLQASRDVRFVPHAAYNAIDPAKAYKPLTHYRGPSPTVGATGRVAPMEGSGARAPFVFNAEAAPFEHRQGNKTSVQPAGLHGLESKSIGTQVQTHPRAQGGQQVRSDHSRPVYSRRVGKQERRRQSLAAHQQQQKKPVQSHSYEGEQRQPSHVPESYVTAPVAGYGYPAPVQVSQQGHVYPPPLSAYWQHFAQRSYPSPPPPPRPHFAGPLNPPSFAQQQVFFHNHPHHSEQPRLHPSTYIPTGFPAPDFQQQSLIPPPPSNPYSNQSQQASGPPTAAVAPQQPGYQESHNTESLNEIYRKNLAIEHEEASRQARDAEALGHTRLNPQPAHPGKAKETVKRAEERAQTSRPQDIPSRSRVTEKSPAAKALRDQKPVITADPTTSAIQTWAEGVPQPDPENIRPEQANPSSSVSALDPNRRGTRVVKVPEGPDMDSSEVDMLLRGYSGRFATEYPGHFPEPREPSPEGRRRPEQNKKLFGAHGLLSRGNKLDAPAQQLQLQRQQRKISPFHKVGEYAGKIVGKGLKTKDGSNVRHPSDKVSPAKEIINALKRSKSDSNKKNADEYDIAGNPQQDDRGPPISMSPGDQMWILARIEFILTLTANNFLMQQKNAGRMTVDSVRRVTSDWRKRNKPQPHNFMFDLSTQLDLAHLNADRLVYHGHHAQDSLMRASLMSSWRNLARDLGNRTYCMPDTVIKKIIVDGFRLLEMLGAQNEAFIEFRDMQRRLTEAAERAARQRADRHRRPEQSQHGITRTFDPLPISSRGLVDDEERYYGDGIYKGPTGSFK